MSSWAEFLTLSMAVAGCGYQPLYAHPSGEHLSVRLVRSLVPDAIASDEVVSGVREELARDGALASGEGYPSVEVEVLRADASSAGIAATPSAPGAGAGQGQAPPLARGTDFGLLARGWVMSAPGAQPTRDTGDLRAADLVTIDVNAPGATSVAPELRADEFHHAEALRAAARRLGRRIGRRVLGLPSLPTSKRGAEASSREGGVPTVGSVPPCYFRAAAVLPSAYR